MAVIPAGDNDRFEHFQSYTEGYYEAQRQQRPLLVILNPPADAENQAITLDAVRRTRHRRALLENYVVVVVDTGTSHGRKVHELFDSPQLPRVVVIDKRQQRQIFQTSEFLQGEQWNQILETYQAGERPAPLNLFGPVYCPT